MDKRDAMRLHPWIIGAQAKMRYTLGLRPETRLDELIFRDGTVFHELPNGTFVGVRKGYRWREIADEVIWADNLPER